MSVIEPAVESAASQSESASVLPVKLVRKPALPALTGVRIFLAINIMFFHFTPPHIEWIRPIVNEGFVFVGFFLLISGFILSYNYGDRGKVNKKDFYIARIARLYPVYVLSLVVSLHMLMEEFHYQTRVHFFEGLIATPLLLQGWNPMLATFWNTVAWTLSTEATLYLLFPFLIQLPWPKTVGKLIVAILVVWVVGLIPHFTYLLTNPDGLAEVNRYAYGYWLRALKYTPLPYVCTFVAGILLGKLHAAVPLNRNQRLAVAAPALILTISFFYFVAMHVPYVLLHGGLLTPLFAALVMGLAGENLVADFFGWKPLAKLGETTLCLYLLHFNLWLLIHDFHLPEKLHVTSYDPWISYVAIILTAYLAFRFYETPLRKLISARVLKKAPHPMERAA